MSNNRRIGGARIYSDFRSDSIVREDIASNVKKTDYSNSGNDSGDKVNSSLRVY